MTNIDYIVIFLIVANIIVSYKGWNDFNFFRKYEFHIGSIRAGEQIRMFTSGFLHADVAHLLFNMLTLLFFAPVVIDTIGKISFCIVYFGSLLSGSFLTLLFNKNNYNYRAVGASGAVTGVLYSAILLKPNMIIGVFFIIPMPAYLFGILYLLYSIYGMKAQNDNIGHSAHFGGAVGGYLITLIKLPILLVENTLMVILLAIPILILLVLEKNKNFH